MKKKDCGECTKGLDLLKDSRDCYTCLETQLDAALAEIKRLRKKKD